MISYCLIWCILITLITLSPRCLSRKELWQILLTFTVEKHTSSSNLCQQKLRGTNLIVYNWPINGLLPDVGVPAYSIFCKLWFCHYILLFPPLYFFWQADVSYKTTTNYKEVLKNCPSPKVCQHRPPWCQQLQNTSWVITTIPQWQFCVRVIWKQTSGGLPLREGIIIKSSPPK